MFKQNAELTQILLEVEETYKLPPYLQIPLIAGLAVTGAALSGLRSGLMALSPYDLAVSLT